MADDGIKFDDIQRMFAERDRRREEERRKALEEERQAREAARNGRRKPSQTRTSSNHSKPQNYRPRTEEPGIALRKPTNLKNEPKYNKMRPKNIRLTPFGKKVVAAAATIVVVGTIGLGVLLGNGASPEPTVQPTDPNPIVTVDPIVDESPYINASEIDYSDSVYILRAGTDNAMGMVNTTKTELDELGANSIVINDDADVLATISDARANNPGDRIIIINIDANANNTEFSNVIMTNYNNDAVTSSDGLALAISAESENEYGINSIVKCGKKDVYSGERTQTSIERLLTDNGITDVVAVTVCPNQSYLSHDLAANNVASSIVGGIARYETMTPEERTNDYIRRVTFSDTLNGLAGANGVTAEYIRNANPDYDVDRLQYNSSLIVKRLPNELTANVSVNNPAVTTNPNDIRTVYGTYTVAPNDTASQIAESLGVPVSDLVVPSGNINNIQVGQEIGYSTTEGPVLVAPSLNRVK